MRMMALSFLVILGLAGPARAQITVIGEVARPVMPGRYELPVVPPGGRFIVLVRGEHGSVRRIGSYSREELQSVLDLCRTQSEEVCDTFNNAIILAP